MKYQFVYLKVRICSYGNYIYIYYVIIIDYTYVLVS